MSIPGPSLGPCESWIGGDDVASCCNVTAGVSEETLETVAVEASMMLFELSGRQFPGLCSRTVRPCSDACDCWGPASLGLGPWYWNTATSFGIAGWHSECGDHCGCQPLSTIPLAGYPVREIEQVLIDGDVLDVFDENGNLNYRIDNWRDLVRMGDPGPPYQRRQWPGCQNLDLDSDQPGTFEITYLWGVEPPQLGRDAAAALACQLLLSCTAGVGGDCKLPDGATRVSRQGVTIEREVMRNWLDPTVKSTGITVIDMFIGTYWRKAVGRRPMIYSPDLPQYPRRVG